MKNLLLNERNIIFLIILNAILIFVGGYTHLSISLLDSLFTILFGLELYFNLREYGRTYFKSSWNIFDAVLIVISLPSLTVLFGVDSMDLSMLLALRTLRVFKIFRFFRFIPNIDNIIESIIRGVRTSIIIIISFAIMIFCISILNNYMFSEYEQFATPLESLYNTFKVFTVEGWYEVPEEISSDMPQKKAMLTKWYFAFILILGGIFGLSFVNAILVDAMVLNNNDDLERKVDNLSDKIDKLQ